MKPRIVPPMTAPVLTDELGSPVVVKSMKYSLVSVR